MVLYILLIMIFMHILDDYVLQAPCLSNLKQKSWWKQNAPERMYKNDYKVALAMHAFSWSFMVHLPVVITTELYLPICISILCNALIHALIDDAKANHHLINLKTDQSMHLSQIVLIWTLFYRVL